MASRLINGIIYSDVNGVIASSIPVKIDECVYKLKSKHTIQGYFCKTSCGFANKHYLGEQLCDYCGRPIKFVGRNGQPKQY